VVQLANPAQKRISGPRTIHGELVDHRRVQLRPRQVLAFPVSVQPRKATPRAQPLDPDDE
jgi:hypothetical protein